MTNKIHKTDKYTFQVVEKVAPTFKVWNIGRHMQSETLVPFCLRRRPADPENYEIDPKTLKAVEVTKEEAIKLRKAGSYGVGNLAQAQQALANTEDSNEANQMRELAKQAISIFERITL